MDKTKYFWSWEMCNFRLLNSIVCILLFTWLLKKYKTNTFLGFITDNSTKLNDDNINNNVDNNINIIQIIIILIIITKAIYD